jgi:hypothetical protein
MGGRDSGDGSVAYTDFDHCANGTIKAQVLAGYIDAHGGRRLAYALYVNDAGQFTSIADVIGVIQDEAQISTPIYQLN